MKLHISRRSLGSLIFLSLIMIQHSLCSRSFAKLPDFDKSQAYSETQEGLTVNMQLFTRQDCKDYFGLDTISHRSRPLLLHIINDTDKTYYLHPEEINLQLISDTIVSEKVAFPLLPIVFAIGTPGLCYLQHRSLPITSAIAVIIWLYKSLSEN